MPPKEAEEADCDSRLGDLALLEDSADHLSTQHLQASIRRRTLSGAIASAGSQGGQLALIVVYNAVLARLLSPHDFGLVAMVAGVAGFLQVFRDAGLSTATIQREHITHAQVSNLFWINLAVGAGAMLALTAAAPLVAWFFHQPELMLIAAALSVSFVLDGLVVQPLAILNRQMQFTLVSGMELGCAAGGFVIGIGMALTHFGYWSLVGATLSTAALRTATIWWLSRWRPQRPTRGSGTRPLVRFGADLTLVGVIYAVSRGFDTLLIGRYLGSDAVGLYSRATALLMRPLERLIAPVYAVIVPALSRLQGEPERYRRAFLQVFEGLAIAAFVLAGILLPLAHPLVRVILGEKWDAAGPIFSALTPAVVCVPLAMGVSWLYTSQGRGRDLLWTACIGAAIMVGSFSAGLAFGVTGVAAAYSASSLLILPLTFYIGGRTGPVTTRDLWSSAVSHLPVYFFVAGATWLVREWIAYSLAPFWQLLVSAAVGGVAGAAALFIFPRSRRATRGFVLRLQEFPR